MAETPVTFPEMKQLIRLALKDSNDFVKDLDPRALSFRANHITKLNGEK